jgi:hypothetical protein
MTTVATIDPNVREIARLAAEHRWDEVEARAKSLAANETAPAGPPFDLIGPPEGLWAPLDPPRYTVAGVLPAASVTLLAGYSASLKSWLALDLAFCVGSGFPWLRHAPFTTERGAVTYLDKEAGAYELRRRLHAIRHPFGVVDDPLLDIGCHPRGNVFDGDFRKRIEDLASTRALIVVDTLAAFSVGVDENTAAMADGVGFFAEIASKTGCTFVVVAHEKKKGANGGETDRRERVRGSSAIFGAVDCVFSLQRNEAREPVEVEQTKARNGREADPFTVEMLDVPGGVTFKVAAKVEPKPETPTDRIAALTAQVVDAVRNNPRCSLKVVRAHVRGRGVDVDAAIERAEAQGLIRDLNASGSKGKSFVVMQEAKP